MRKIFESLGAAVDWNETTQTITATKDDTKIVMQISKNDMQVNDKTITLDVPPQIIDDRTLVPVRAVAESFDADVSWDNEKQVVSITTTDDPIPTPQYCTGTSTETTTSTSQETDSQSSDTSYSYADINGTKFLTSTDKKMADRYS
jgi:Copper amine oxidase N-terminal domain.